MSEMPSGGEEQLFQSANVGNEVESLQDVDEPVAEADEEETSQQKKINEEAPPAVDLVRQYLRAIGKYPLLTAEQEVELAHAAEAGSLAAEKIDSNNVGDYDVNELKQLVELGQYAQESLITSNLRLAVSWAKRYQGKGVELLDLIQAANIGLMRAVEKFDYTKGYKFSTYASWWLRQALQRVIADEGRNIRVPVHYVEQINKFNRAKEALTKKLDREPTIGEIAQVLGVGIEKAEEIATVIAMQPASLQSIIGEDAEFGDFIIDSHSDTELSAEMNTLRTLIDDALSAIGLSEQEKEIFELRHGLRTGKAMSHKEIALMYGFTPSRSQQIASDALRKIKRAASAKNPHFTELKEYLS